MAKIKLLVCGVLVVFMTVSGVSLCMAAGNLVIYNAGSPEMGEDLIRAFNGKYPDIKVEIIRAGSGELLTRIKAEASRPQGDIIMAIAKENLEIIRDLLQPLLIIPEASNRRPVPSHGYTAATGFPLFFSLNTLPSPVTPIGNSPRPTKV